MPNCGACGRFTSATGGAACSLCPLKFHKACLILPDKADISRDWACPNCKKNVKKGDNSQTPVKGIYEAAPTAETSSTGGSEGTAEGEMDCRDGNLITFMAEMREFRKEMNALRRSLSARLDSFDQRLSAVEQRQSEANERDTAALERAVAEKEQKLSAVEQYQARSVTKDTVELERIIADLRQELNDRDQEALLADLEIGELPEERGVSVVQAVTVLATRLGVALEPRDVIFAERVGAPPSQRDGRARRVVVRLARRELRDEQLRAARVRRGVVAPAPAHVDEEGSAPAGRRVYVNERLTRHNRQLFHLVRARCRECQWRYSWTKRGRVYVRRADGTSAFQIRSQPDVERVFGPLEK